MPTKTTITVTVRLFASYREAVGKAELPLDMPSGATVGGLAREMVQRYPGLPRVPKRLVVAVNQEYRDHRHVLRDADEVALIPPVSGGAIHAPSPVAGEAFGHDPLWPKSEG
ncbi:MAG: molybdopterin converting factor subunit 1 [SAR202 cluster bacterium]|nr:molybdopterin converting factor subunit 1 [SAR202 cluster bacterium]